MKSNVGVTVAARNVGSIVSVGDEGVIALVGGYPMLTCHIERLIDDPHGRDARALIAILRDEDGRTHQAHRPNAWTPFALANGLVVWFEPSQVNRLKAELRASGEEDVKYDRGFAEAWLELGHTVKSAIRMCGGRTAGVSAALAAIRRRKLAVDAGLC